MGECVQASIGDRLACILTYDNSEVDQVINYTLLFLGFFPFMLLAWPALDGSASRRYHLCSRLAAFTFFSAFQVALCLLVGCAGVSIIWCACLGATVSDFRRYNSDFTGGARAVMAFDLAGLLYYAATAPALTTIAHVCAIAMGALEGAVQFRLGGRYTIPSPKKLNEQDPSPAVPSSSASSRLLSTETD